MTLYDKVKALADENGASIAAIEIKAGVANGTIAGWKAGRPYADTLKKVADALGVKMDDLLAEVAT